MISNLVFLDPSNGLGVQIQHGSINIRPTEGIRSDLATDKINFQGGTLCVKAAVRPRVKEFQSVSK